jgi:hypothetical protein
VLDQYLLAQQPTLVLEAEDVAETLTAELKEAMVLEVFLLSRLRGQMEILGLVPST